MVRDRAPSSHRSLTVCACSAMVRAKEEPHDEENARRAASDLPAGNRDGWKWKRADPGHVDGTVVDRADRTGHELPERSGLGWLSLVLWIEVVRDRRSMRRQLLVRV